MLDDSQPSTGNGDVRTIPSRWENVKSKLVRLQENTLVYKKELLCFTIAIIVVASILFIVRKSVAQPLQSAYLTSLCQLAAIEASVNAASSAAINITSLAELNGIDHCASAEALDIRIQNLSDLPLSGLSLQNPPFVQELIISGEISEKWLMRLVQIFQKTLKKLTISMNNLCLGSREPSPETLENNFANIQLNTLVIRNDTLCDISAWIYSWEYSQLRHIVLNGLRFRIRPFKAFRALLHKTSEKMENTSENLTVTGLSNVNMCSICELKSIQTIRHVIT